MKKKLAIGVCILAVLLVVGGLWYTRPVNFSTAFPEFQTAHVTSCSATLVPTYTSDAIQNVEISPDSPHCRQLLELLNGETYTRQIGFVSNVQRITLEPYYAHLHLRQGEDQLSLSFYGPQMVAQMQTSAGKQSVTLFPQGGEKFQASVVELLTSLVPGTEG